MFCFHLLKHCFVFMMSSIGVLDWFLGEFFSDCVYEIERPMVEIGGEGIHDEYHLELNQNSFVKEVIASFRYFVSTEPLEAPHVFSGKY